MAMRRPGAGPSCAHLFGYNGDNGIKSFRDFRISMDALGNDQLRFELENSAFKGLQPLFGDGCGVAATTSASSCYAPSAPAYCAS